METTVVDLWGGAGGAIYFVLLSYAYFLVPYRTLAANFSAVHARARPALESWQACRGLTRRHLRWS